MSARDDKLAAALTEYWQDTLVPPRTHEFRTILAALRDAGFAVVPVEQLKQIASRAHAMIAAAQEDSSDA